MTRRYRVLHLITTFPVSSGAAENARLTVNLLDPERFEVFLGTRPGQSMEGELASHVKRIPLRWLHRPIRPLVDVLAFFQLLRVLREHHFDVVHTHNAKDGILGRWAACLASVPAVVHTVHNVSFRASTNSSLSAFYAWQERRAARITHRILAVSRENVREYLSRGIGRPEQYRTVYSGLELTRYMDDGRSAAECRAALGLPERPGPWVAWLGRFNPQKDPVTFVQAARHVVECIPGVQFVVCGDDPVRPSIQAASRILAHELGLSEDMHFLGFRRDVATVLKAVDLVMHSSRYEGMGRTVCEALACARAVAGTAVDGVVEVIVSGERGGLLVPPGDARALGAAACQLLQDRTLANRLAKSGREWVRRHLTAERMVKAIECVYTELLRDDLGHGR